MSAELPRIPPVSPEALSDEQKALVGDWAKMNFTTVIVKSPSLYRVLLPLIAKLISGSELPPRDREILVLRTLGLCGETYESAHHATIARKAGLEDSEIEAARDGAAADLPAFEGDLVRAAGQLVEARRVSDATWSALAERYSEVQLMEVVSLVGGYTLMAMLTKNCEIPLEDPAVFASLDEARDYT